MEATKADPVLPKQQYRLVRPSKGFAARIPASASVQWFTPLLVLSVRINEEKFWRNYFYRVWLLRKEVGVHALPLSPDGQCLMPHRCHSVLTSVLCSSRAAAQSRK
jgi:hypothetical protein